MKKVILFISIAIYANDGFSQSMKIKEIDSLTKEQYFGILKKEFNGVINSSGKNTIGNYASADIKDGKLAFNATKNFKNGNMLSVNANGGVTDGIFAVFNETKINSNIGVDFKYNMLFKGSSVSFDTDELTKLKTHLKNADEEYKLNQAIREHEATLLDKKLNLIKIEITLLQEQINKKDILPSDKATLEYQLALKTLQQDSISYKIQTLKPIEEATDDNSSKRKKAKKTALADFEYTGIVFKWFSIGGGLQNNNFNLFNSKFSTLDSQIVKQNYTTWTATAEFNLYHWDQYSRPTYYVLVGGKFNIDDNFSDLSKIELTDTKQYIDTTSTTQRSSTKKITGYSGDYETKLMGGKVYLDFYAFFLKNAAAIHIYPEVNIKEHSKPLYNAGVGLLYSFMDAKDDKNKAKLNAELYFNVSDLTDNADSKKTVIERNELGLRLSIPIAFFNF